MSIVALLGIGVTVTLAAGGFDLSVGSVADRANGRELRAGRLARQRMGGRARVVLGRGRRLVQRLLITRLRVPDQLATLGTLFLLAGLQLIPTGRSLATGSVLPTHGRDGRVPRCVSRARPVARVFDVVPLPVLLLAAVHGAGLRDDGGDPLGPRDLRDRRQRTAARLAGAPAARYRVAAYVVSGAIASLGGVLIAARVGAAT